MSDLILKLAALQALFLASLLLKNKKVNKANLVLVILIFSIGVSCLLYSFQAIDFYLQFPHLIRIDWGLPLIFGPLIYLYTLFLTSDKKWKSDYLFHFVPYLINLLILIPFFIKSGESKIQILDYFTANITRGTDAYIFYDVILHWAIAISGLAYAEASIKLLSDYKKRLLNEYSDIEKRKLDWLLLLLYSFLLVSVAFVIASIFVYSDRYPDFDYYVYYFMLLFMLIYILSYKALGRAEVLDFDTIDVSPSSKPSSIVKKMSVEGKQLQTFIAEQKPYLDGELTASKLADSLGLSRHQLSKILNEEIGKSFYDYINENRVAEFKRKAQLPENNHLTLLAIALDAGFNSKTSFNTIFKRNTGLTPSQYLKSLRGQ